jgi:hypothetical protein
VTLDERCNAVEEFYEFMLAYAAQGLTHVAGGSPIREFLRNAVSERVDPSARAAHRFISSG